MAIENALEEKTEAKFGPEEVAALVDKGVQEALAKLPRQAPQVQYVQAPTPQVSRYNQTLAQLEKDGVPREAIENSARIAAAIIADRESQGHTQTVEQVQRAFVKACNDKTEEALDELGVVISAYKAGGDGLRIDLRNRVANLFIHSPKYSDVLSRLQAGEYPSTRRLKEASAEVLDAYCKEAGLTRPTGPVNVESSKPKKADAESAPDQKLSRSAYFIYNMQKKLGKSETEARKLALIENKENPD
jgi:hypothetical protein